MLYMVHMSVIQVSTNKREKQWEGAGPAHSAAFSVPGSAVRTAFHTIISHTLKLTNCTRDHGTNFGPVRSCSDTGFLESQRRARPGKCYIANYLGTRLLQGFARISRDIVLIANCLTARGVAPIWSLGGRGKAGVPLSQHINFPDKTTLFSTPQKFVENFLTVSTF